MNNRAVDDLRALFAKPTGRLAILGIGNELNGDDAAGVLVARGLTARLNTLRAPAGDQILVIEAGPAPESFTGPLRRFAPNLVVLVDAAEMEEPAGTVRVFDWTEAEGMSASTHSMPPSMLAKFLVAELGCRVALVGIQPAGLAFDSGVSQAVRISVQEIVSEIASLAFD